MSLRFGIFEFDPSKGLLYREGNHVRLQAQPAQVLALLLQKNNEVVTRAEIREAVWGSDIHVDFDRGLNFCVAQIRSALGDSAGSPIYIRTIPKLGYQFIAPVTAVDDGSSHIAEVAIPRQNPATWNTKWVAVFAIAGLSLMGLVVLGRHIWPLGQAQTESSQVVRVAVARFDNETGDPQFDRITDALSDSVTSRLTLSSNGRYGVIGNASVLRVPRRQRDLTGIGSTLHAGYIVLAQLRRDPSHTYLLAHLIHLPDQTHVAVIELTCPADESIQNQSDMAQKIVDRFSSLIESQVAAGPARLMP